MLLYTNGGFAGFCRRYEVRHLIYKQSLSRLIFGDFRSARLKLTSDEAVSWVPRWSSSRQEFTRPGV